LNEESPEYGPRWSDQRVERMLGALVCAVVGLLLAMIVTVFVRGWPSFAHNGLAWFGAGGDVDDQLNAIFLSGHSGAEYIYTFHAWPLIWSTILVIYGLIGVVVLVPFIGNHLVTEPQKSSVAGVISLTGYSLLAAITVLTVMIAPLMVSIFSDGLRSVKPGWIEGSLALGVNRWRTTWKIVVRTARPAIVAGTVLAVARAIGEAVMLAMISGSVGFAPNPADGLIFIYEPSRPLAPTIVKNIDQLSSPPANATLFAIATVLLFSAAFLSLTGWVARRAMKKYGAA
jgi:phosphate transport system permease protein